MRATEGTGAAGTGVGSRPHGQCWHSPLNSAGSNLVPGSTTRCLLRCAQFFPHAAPHLPCLAIGSSTPVRTCTAALYLSACAPPATAAPPRPLYLLTTTCVPGRRYVVWLLLLWFGSHLTMPPYYASLSLRPAYGYLQPSTFACLELLISTPARTSPSVYLISAMRSPAYCRATTLPTTCDKRVLWFAT